MASRKDFAQKKRSTSKPASAKPIVRKPKPAPQKAAPSKTESVTSTAPKKTWKLILASLIAISTIGLLLTQLIKVDPREIREAGISAIIDENTDTPTVSTTVSTPTPLPIKKETVTATNKPASKPKKTTKTTPVPKVPVSDKSTVAKQKEPYQFYKILAENSVETETIEAYKSTPKTAKLNNKTLLQTGSFRNAKDAERMKVRLLLNNFPKVAVNKTVSASGITWYRVRTGPYIKFNSLKSALIKLNKMNISPMQIPIK